MSTELITTLLFYLVKFSLASYFLSKVEWTGAVSSTIDHPQNKADVVDWVLHPFGKEDAHLVEEKIKQIAEHTPLLIQNNDQTFMNRMAGQ